MSFAMLIVLGVILVAAFVLVVVAVFKS